MTSDDLANSKDNRPLSPHLTVYKPQITSVLSITHRLTGVGLYVGVFVLAWAIIMGIYGCDCILPLMTSTLPGKILLFCWSTALFYHALNGVRHLLWDTGRGFDLKCVTSSGVFVVIGAVSLTVISWVLALGGF